MFESLNHSCAFPAVIDSQNGKDDITFANKTDKDIESLRQVEDVSEIPRGFMNLIWNQSRDDFKNPDESHAKKQFQVDQEFVPFVVIALVSIGFSLVGISLANDNGGQGEHDGVGNQEQTNWQEKPNSFGFNAGEKASFFTKPRLEP